MLNSTSRLSPDDPMWFRVAMTTACRDADYIPKVPNAGDVVDHPEHPYQIMHNGIKVLSGGYNGLWQTEIVRQLKGHHEPQEEKVFHELLKRIDPGATMLELGAFWAYYSAWFQHAIPNAVNYLIEPDPNSLAVGQANFALNHLKGNFIHGCIASTSGTDPDFIRDDGTHQGPTPRLCVDDLLKTYNIDHLDILHSDIQGAELEMLKGCERSIADHKIRFIFISTHHHSISHDPIIHYKCLEFLIAHNAHIIASHTIDQSYSGDGLIVASFAPADRSIPPIPVSHNTAGNNMYRETEFDLSDVQLQTAHTLAQIKAAHTQVQEALQHQQTTTHDDPAEIRSLLLSLDASLSIADTWKSPIPEGSLNRPYRFFS